MTDFTDPAAAPLRLSNTERDAAILSLESHARDGRLTQAEVSERTAAVRAATTRGDLAPLFADLPAPAVGSVAATPRHSDIHVLHAIRNAIPFVSVVLFFLTGWFFGFQYAWLWFVLVPLAWSFSWAGAGSRDR